MLPEERGREKGGGIDRFDFPEEKDHALHSPEQGSMGR